MGFEILDIGLLAGSLAAIASGLIQGYSGFAGALIIVPVLAVLFSPIEAIAISVVAGLAGNLVLMRNAAKNVNWREAGVVSFAIAISIPLGLLFLLSAEPIVIRRGMGVFILLAAFLLMSGWTYKGPRGVAASWHIITITIVRRVMGITPWDGGGAVTTKSQCVAQTRHRARRGARW